jgi:NADPH-dependent 2,4-dienoyl-CoA reductase/sulfur reductase-like enzyme/rhodanese-related sulfurtransferase
VGLKGVHTVFTVPDADDVLASAAGATTAVVVGGGFIGLETAENLVHRGLKTILVEKAPRLMSNMDEEFSLVIKEQLCGAGIDVHLDTGLKEIKGSGAVEGVVLEDGTEIPCSMVILAMGVRPNTQLAVKAGLTLGVTGGVVTDATMRTSEPDIYAAGDMVESLHLVTGKKVRIPLAGSANKQGRVAGACAAGSKLLFKGVLGTSVIKVFELTAARTGLSETEAKAAGLAHQVLYIPGNSNATYYPGAEPMILKLTVAEPTGKLLGAQAIGGNGVDKRIDVLATAIYAGLTVFDLEDLDLAYAPPYSSAKDPVIMSGMVASNMLRGEMAYVTPQELTAFLNDKAAVLLDVRTAEEYAGGHIDGARLLPVDELRARYTELDPEKTYVVYCAVGYRAYNACRFLMSKGYRVVNLSGGYRAYTMRACEPCCRRKK